MVVERRWKKLYTAVIVVIVAVSLYLVYRVKKHDFLDNKLQEMVNSKTNQLYNLTYDSIFVNEAKGHLYIKNLRVRGDTARQIQLFNSGDTNAAKMILDIFIPQLKIERFKTASALLSKQMECDSILINDPKITVYIFPGGEGQKDVKKQQEELYKQILGNLKLIKAQSVQVTNGEVVALDFFTKEKKFQAYQTSVDLTNVAIDSTYNQDTSRTLFCKEINVRTGKVILGDKNNTAEITAASFDTRSKIITLSSFEYDSYKNNGFFKTKVDGISLEGFNWAGPVENSVVEIDKVILRKGDLDVLTASKPGGAGKSNRNILTGWIKSFTINKFEVKSIDYTSRKADSKEKPMTLKNNSFFLKNIHINRASKLDESLVNEAKEIELSNDEIKIVSKDKRYQFRFLDVKINSKDKKISVKKIQVIPLYSEPVFARIARYQVDRYDINFFNFVCNNADIPKFINGEINIDNISTSNSVIKVFRDLSYPIDSVSRRSASETFPHQLIRKLTTLVRVKKFVANNLYLEYKEKNPLSQSSGRVRFAKSTLTVNNISNYPPKKDEQMTARFSTLFLDKIPMTGAFTFFADEWRKGKFMAEANVSKEVDAKLLTELTEPMSLARIDKGVINSVSFKTTADTATSNGHLAFSYKDLKVSLLKKKGNEYAKKDVMSFLANILVKDKNKAGEGMRTADVSVSRNRYKSFFNYIWMTIFKGMRQTIAIKI